MTQTQAVSPHEEPERKTQNHNPDDDHGLGAQFGAPPKGPGFADRMAAASKDGRHSTPMTLNGPIRRCPSSGHVEACAHQIQKLQPKHLRACRGSQS